MAQTSALPSSADRAQLALVPDLRLPPQVLIFLQALLASRKHRGEQEATALLKEAAELHFSSMQGLPLGSEYFEKLDPLFLVCIAREYLFFCPRQVRAGRKAHLHRGSGRWGGGGRGGRERSWSTGSDRGKHLTRLVTSLL